MELGCIDEANRFWALVQPILFFQRREENILLLDCGARDQLPPTTNMAWMHFVSVPGKEAMLPQCTAMARGAPQEDFKEAAKLSLIKNISRTFQGLLKNISLSDKKKIKVSI